MNFEEMLQTNSLVHEKQWIEAIHAVRGNCVKSVNSLNLQTFINFYKYL